MQEIIYMYIIAIGFSFQFNGEKTNKKIFHASIIRAMESIYAI